MLETYRTVFINDAEALARHKPRILGLFSACFGSELDPALWDWAYRANPCGDAYVALAFSGEDLVGHYAAIPQRCRRGGSSAEFVLSMTTMVHADHRAAGLFRDLALLTYEEAGRKGALGVFGFPNKNSLPGFKKRLGWRVDESLQLQRHALDRAGLSKAGPGAVRAITPEDFLPLFRPPQDAYLQDLGNRDYLSWRLRKPGQSYQTARLGGELFIFKPFREGLDVVYASALNEEIFRELAKFAAASGFDALTVLSARPLAETAAPTPYYFGSRAFDGGNHSFAVNPIMSDVF